MTAYVPTNDNEIEVVAVRHCRNRLHLIVIDLTSDDNKDDNEEGVPTLNKAEVGGGKGGKCPEKGRVKTKHRDGGSEVGPEKRNENSGVMFGVRHKS